MHDEFSYLLSGDTFAHGRMTNEASPMWVHFETFHELQQPTYSSMYPAGQGLFLALGELVGAPWIGVLLSMGLMCSAISWMTMSYLPARWALVAGLLAVVRFAVFSYWVDSYWGGAVAALGGALLLGAAIRLVVNKRTSRSIKSLSICSAVGFLLLLNTRPYEGLLFSIPVFCFVSYCLLSEKALTFKAINASLVPGVVVGVAGVVLMCGYFWHVTGSPFVMPYDLHQQQYSTTQPFLWQSMLPEPHYRHVVLRDYYKPQAAYYWQAHSLGGWLKQTELKAISLLMFYIWPSGLIILWTMTTLWRADRIFRFLIVIAAFVFAGLTLEIWPMMLHYAAPLTSVFLLITVLCLRHVRSFEWRGKPIGQIVSWSLPLLCLCMLGLRVSAAALHSVVPDEGMVPWFTVRQGNIARAQIEHRFEQKPGKHLVIVRYSADHDLSNEWVYNSANLTSAPVLWAREMSPEQDASLIHFFNDRDAWLLEPDSKPIRLVPYTSQALFSAR